MVTARQNDGLIGRVWVRFFFGTLSCHCHPPFHPFPLPLALCPCTEQQM